MGPLPGTPPDYSLPHPFRPSSKHPPHYVVFRKTSWVVGPRQHECRVGRLRPEIIYWCVSVPSRSDLSHDYLLGGSSLTGERHDYDKGITPSGRSHFS